jgi:hypothetical protein
LQLRYEKHRKTRNEQQRIKILAEDFPGWSLDEILMRLDGPAKEEGFLDPRNCLVIWARPPPHIRDLISFVQSELKDVAPCKFHPKIMVAFQSTHAIRQPFGSCPLRTCTQQSWK